MQHIMRNDALVDVGTFLARRWSNNENVTIEFSNRGEAKTRTTSSRITLLPADKLDGDGFQRYRQFRVRLWHEAMRLRLCNKILSNDHAFGFILNTLETRRVELVGRRTWRGMDEELVFDYAYQWSYRPLLNEVYGQARIVEGFYQQFLFGRTKGEIAANQLDRVKSASVFAHDALNDAVKNELGTTWLEKKIPEIVSILGIDSLLTIPIALPWMKPGMAMTQEELLKSLVKTSKILESDIGSIDPKTVMIGSSVRSEYGELVDEDKRGASGTQSTEHIGIRVPPRTDVDETAIYDPDLVSGLKARFKDWKSGWSERHVRSGDEFDEESYIERHDPFLTDIRHTIRTRITILLDHSSSISGDQLEYKKAALALCEVLSYLRIGFSVYAFSTVDKSVVCWSVKSETQRWNSICAKRLAQIVANGSTPLAEVYNMMYSIVQSGKPGIFLTMTDGEPADPGAVRSVIKSYKSLGTSMVALGLGPDAIRATAIASNLKYLGYEKTLAVSRLGDIPSKVLRILRDI